MAALGNLYRRIFTEVMRQELAHFESLAPLAHLPGSLSAPLLEPLRVLMDVGLWEPSAVSGNFWNQIMQKIS